MHKVGEGNDIGRTLRAEARGKRLENRKHLKITQQRMKNMRKGERKETEI